MPKGKTIYGDNQKMLVPASRHPRFYTVSQFTHVFVQKFLSMVFATIGKVKEHP